MTRIVLLGTLMMALFVGCTLAPDYNRPAPPVSAGWPQGPAYTQAPEGQRAADEIDWEEFYTDEKLRRVIAMALGNNRDLRVAVANIERVSALYRIQRADLLPTVYAAGLGTDERQPASISSSGESSVVRQYSVGIGFTDYEIDLFGRVRSLTDRALEQYLSTEQARRSVQIALIAEVATAFLTIAADRERLNVARDTFKSQKESYDLIEKRFRAGASTELDLRQAQTRLEAARRDIAFYTGRLAQDENGLTLLVGQKVPAELLPAELGPDTALRDISVGLPSEELLKRPDILQAEHLLKAANANIGAARAAFFPRITLSTAFGTVSPQLSGLFKAGSDTWGISPQITLPIFDTGRNLANLAAAKAERDMYLAQYEKAIQTAFKEVADALAHHGTVQDQLAAQQSLTNAAAGAYRLSDARYKNGVDSYLPVLDAQRSLYAAQEILVTLRLARLTNMVTLYKVLGGGSNVPPDVSARDEE